MNALNASGTHKEDEEEEPDCLDEEEAVPDAVVDLDVLDLKVASCILSIEALKPVILSSKKTTEDSFGQSTTDSGAARFRVRKTADRGRPLI